MRDKKLHKLLGWAAVAVLAYWVARPRCRWCGEVLSLLGYLRRASCPRCGGPAFSF